MLLSRAHQYFLVSIIAAPLFYMNKLMLDYFIPKVPKVAKVAKEVMSPYFFSFIGFAVGFFA